ncbi:fungal-specific transcription factor domain-containing protein [Mycena vulgaris]|nr:fungal-specific transcription factor domain-containing protein [Mycena vulgaris]
MPSNDEDLAHESQRGKKRRIEPACDLCRRWKTRCSYQTLTRAFSGVKIDSYGAGDRSTPGNKCYACLNADVKCTYLEVSTRPSRARRKSYVESPEERVESLEMQLELGGIRGELGSAAFATSSPGTHSGNGAITSDMDRRNASCTNIQMLREADAEAVQTTEMNKRTASLHMIRLMLGNVTAPPKPADAEDLLHLEMARKFQEISVEDPPGRYFIGKSSSVPLVKAAIDFKAEVNRGELGAGTDEDGGGDGEPRMPFSSRRLQDWRARLIATQPKQSTVYTFPPADLAMHLIDLYFVHVNAYLPLLHRRTIERGLATGLHHRDDGFAAILLLVCAVASRWSNDLRVMVPGGTQGVGVSKPGGRLACGWGWFDQVPMVGNHLFGQPKLYDLQYCCLAGQFLVSSLAPGACWKLVGVGIRLAQEIGAHRRTLPVYKPSVERELWKRAFWVLVYMDRSISATLGRTCAIHHNDFDLDPPIECDEEYWEHPTDPFEQPMGVPSRVAFFNALLRLSHILAFSLPVLYPLKKVRAAYAIDDAWEELVVAELDSALNRWRDEVPEHLRWDPARPDPIFFDQSVALYCAYSHVQIIIHRPFIPMMRKSAPTALPSLAICTSAARTCANMVDVQRRRKAKIPVVINLTAVFTSAVVLLLNVWSGQRTGLVSNPSPEIANVHKCMDMIHLCEDRWESAGLLWDILYELGSLGQVPLPNLSAPRMVGHDHRDHHQGVARNQEPVLPEDTSRGMQQTFDSIFCAPKIQLAPSHTGSSAGLFVMDPSVFTLTNTPDQWFPPADLFTGIHGDPVQASLELDELMNLIDSNTLAMWNAPTGVEADDWGNYLTNFGEITRGQQMMHGDMEMGINGGSVAHPQ